MTDERFPINSMRAYFTNYLDITTPVSQKMLMFFSKQAADDTDCIQLEKLAKVKQYFSF